MTRVGIDQKFRPAVDLQVGQMTISKTRYTTVLTGGRVSKGLKPTEITHNHTHNAHYTENQREDDSKKPAVGAVPA